MKIRIVGACGSGKSTSAKRLSQLYGIPCYEIDNMVYDRSTEPNKRYPKAIRDALLHSAMRQESWVIEGVDCKWTADSFREADRIYILNPPVLLRDYRILRRFFRSRTGIEPWNYKQTVGNLWTMIVKWNHGFDLQEVFDRTAAYAGKRIVVRSYEEIVEDLKGADGQAVINL